MVARDDKEVLRELTRFSSCVLLQEMLCNKLQRIIFRPDGLERSRMQIRDQGHSLAKEAHTHSYQYFLACQLVMSQGLDD